MADGSWGLGQQDPDGALESCPWAKVVSSGALRFSQPGGRGRRPGSSEISYRDVSSPADP